LEARKLKETITMYRFLILSILFLCSSMSTLTVEEKPYYHKVEALDGDNIHVFLDRYHLAAFTCNFDQFYALNKLERGAKLIREKKYFLPILIYKYNGTSIRTSVGFDDWEPAHRVKIYNERLKDEDLRQSSLVGSKIIWVPYNELYCMDSAPKKSPEVVTENTNVSPSKEKEEEETEEVVKVDIKERPVVPNEKIDEKIIAESKKLSGYRKFPIFGKKNAYVPLKDDKLRGKVFYIVSGHGGPDVGAVGKSGSIQLCEDEYAYDVSLRVVKNLLEHGALAYMIVRDPNDGIRDGQILPCDYDEYCWGNFIIPRSQKSRLYQRSDAVNELFERHKKQGINDQVLVTIHIDSNNQSHQSDVFFYYFPGSTDGKKLAVKVRNNLKARYKENRKSGEYHGTVKPRDLHMLREAKPTSIFIELGNIRNSFDQQRFMVENNRQALANWLYEGLVK
jgi:N-acetylmuramoyl-L-alanine amidase